MLVCLLVRLLVCQVRVEKKVFFGNLGRFLDSWTLIEPWTPVRTVLIVWSCESEVLRCTLCLYSRDTVQYSVVMMDTWTFLYAINGIVQTSVWNTVFHYLTVSGVGD